MSYDRALTVFSPDGHLFQVDYAIKAVEKGSSVVGVIGDELIVLGIERRDTHFLQTKETIKKIARLDENILLGFSGLAADARVLIDKVRVEYQNHILRYGEKINVEQVAQYVASCQQSYTIKGGVRPYGVGMLIAGFDNKKPRLFCSEPSGVCVEWKAIALGQNSKEIRKLLEKEYKTQMDFENASRVVIKVMLEAVQASKDNIEVVLVTKENLFLVPEETVGECILELEREKEAELKNTMILG